MFNKGCMCVAGFSVQHFSLYFGSEDEKLATPHCFRLLWQVWVPTKKNAELDMISSFQFTTPAVSLSTQGAEQGLSLPLEPPVSGTCPLLENLLSLSTFLLLAEIQKDRELRPQRTYLVSHSTKPRFLFFYLFSLLSPTLYSSTISFWSLGFIKEEEGGGEPKRGLSPSSFCSQAFPGSPKGWLICLKSASHFGCIL